MSFKGIQFDRYLSPDPDPDLHNQNRNYHLLNSRENGGRGRNKISKISDSNSIPFDSIFPLPSRPTPTSTPKLSTESGTGTSSPIPIPTSSIALTAVSTVSTLALIYWISKDLGGGGNEQRSRKIDGGSGSGSGRSTPLPGYGILGDKVNEFVELFLDALTVYVHNDNKWECQRRMLCEANQRANDYGLFQGVVMYFLSLGVSLLLQNQRVSESLEAMRSGRKGNDCTHLYPKCPFSL